MGGCQHHWDRGEFWVREVDALPGHRPKVEPPLGCNSLYGEQGYSTSDRRAFDRNIWLTSVVDQDSFYRSLDAESSAKAFNNEYDFDSPEASH